MHRIEMPVEVIGGHQSVERDDDRLVKAAGFGRAEHGQGPNADTQARMLMIAPEERPAPPMGPSRGRTPVGGVVSIIRRKPSHGRTAVGRQDGATHLVLMLTYPYPDGIVARPA